MATASAEEESRDLSTCPVCLEPYDKGLRKPKFLSCAHTYCLQCIKGMAPTPATTQIHCPVCKKVSSNVDSLPNNQYIMHIVQLSKIIVEKIGEKFWCETCDCVAKPSCQQDYDHTVTDFIMDDSAKVAQLLLEVSSQLNEAVARREESKDLLDTADIVVDYRDYMAYDLRSRENNDCLLKLSEAIDRCEAIRQLPDVIKAAAFIKGKLEKMLNEAKDGLKEAKEFHYHVLIENLQKTRKIATTDRRRSAVIDFNRSMPGFFTASCLSIRRQQQEFSRRKKFQCWNLTGHKMAVIATEFSADGTLLASGGEDKIVRLWPISSALQSGRNGIVPIEMKTRLVSPVYCLAISPDNRRLFSGEKAGKVFVHDVVTGKLLKWVVDLNFIWSISLKPGSNGDIFALACGDKTLRIYDIRISTALPMQQITVQQELCSLFSVMFSPVDSSVIAAAGSGGTRMFDLRNTNSTPSITRVRHLQPATHTTPSVMFDAKGSRLLCREVDESGGSHLVVRKIPANVQVEMKELQSVGYSVPKAGRNICCFAGDHDELVVASSAVGHGLHIWSVPDGLTSGNRTAESLLTLRGHQQALNSVRYCKTNSSLATCGAESVIKLWSPI